MVSGLKQQLGEFTRLQEKCRLLRTELAKVIVGRDELLNTVKPNLEARYYSVVGKERHRQTYRPSWRSWAAARSIPYTSGAFAWLGDWSPLTETSGRDGLK